MELYIPLQRYPNPSQVIYIPIRVIKHNLSIIKMLFFHCFSFYTLSELRYPCRDYANSSLFSFDYGFSQGGRFYLDSMDRLGRSSNTDHDFLENV